LATETFISRKWLDDFTETFIHRDITRLGFALPINVLKNMLSMIAHLHGSMLNVSMLSNSLGISQITTNKYLELLEGSFLIKRLPPYFLNIGKRLTKSSKIYVRDTGLLHYLLRIFDMESLRGNPAIGPSWEGYVIEQIIREAPEFSDFYYYRTQHGAEIDLLLIAPSGQKIGIEIKLSTSPSISKGFHQSITDIQTKTNYIITPSGERFVRNDGIIVCPLSLFLSEDLPHI
jgi:predicted AAA+ superfamily ATPase